VRQRTWRYPWGCATPQSVKSLLGYAHKVGYTPFNAGAVIKIKPDSAHRGATLAKRIVSEIEISLLIRAAPSKRDRVLLEVAYAGGLRVSEIVASSPQQRSRSAGQQSQNRARSDDAADIGVYFALSRFNRLSASGAPSSLARSYQRRARS
jgi:hypothetical protein